MKETNAAVVGQWEFEYGGWNRDFVACVENCTRQWAHGVKYKILTTTPPCGEATIAQRTGQVEMGHLCQAFEVKTTLEQNLHSPNASKDSVVVNGKHGKIIRDNCRGHDKVKLVCPWTVRFRSYQQAMVTLSNAKESTSSREMNGKIHMQPNPKKSLSVRRKQPRRFQGRGKKKALRNAEEAYKVETDSNVEDAKVGLESLAILLAIKTMFLMMNILRFIAF